jgi:hypothetical protein
MGSPLCSPAWADDITRVGCSEFIESTDFIKDVDPSPESSIAQGFHPKGLIREDSSDTQ